MFLHISASVAGRFKNCLLAGKFSKSPSDCTIVPVIFACGSRMWSSVMLARIFHPPLVIESLETVAIEESASPRKPKVVRFSKSISEEILLVA